MSQSAAVRWCAFLLTAALLGACEGPATDTDPPEPVCGNGLVEQDEPCDDGNDVQTDVCLSTCVLATCGDGILFATTEECDEGAANADAAACRTDCSRQRCGDGDVGPGEECDDANLDDADSCARDCTLTGCGDGVLAGLEECDDGDDDDGDGCTKSCFVEPGWVCDGACRCEEGQAGPGCADCAPGYQDGDGDGACLPDCSLFALTDGCDLEVSTCVIDGGAPTCACNAGLYEQGGACAPPPICRVHVTPSADGDGSGSSWSNAKTSLQAGIDTAAGLAEGTLDGRCEVWASAGTWFVFATNPADTLLLRTGVVVRGGFAGDETDLDQRPIDPATGLMEYESVLDGRGACTHVVTGASDATLDGFVVTGGNASGFRGTPGGMGGGLFASEAGDLVVSNTLFRDNYAKSGGAVHVDGGSLVIERSRFVDNVAHWDGGAVHATAYDSLDVVDSWFGQNHQMDGWGGAIYSFASGLLSIEGTTFVDNASRWDGGGLFHVGAGAVSIVDSRFVDNNSTVWMGCIGGGALLRGILQVDVNEGRAVNVAPLASVSLVNVDFVGNSVPFEGGGLYLRSVASVSVVGGQFKGNVAGRGEDYRYDGGIGGGLVGYDVGDVSFEGTSFVGNEANWKGGAVAILEAESLSFDESTLDGNFVLTGEGGGLLAKDVEGTVSLRETVFSDNWALVTGGGAHVENFDHLAIDGGAFLDNEIESYSFGAGLFAHGDIAVSTASVDGTVFDDNYGPNTGIALGATYLAALDVRRSVFRRNGLDPDRTPWGGAVYLRWVRDIGFDDTDFEDNAPDRQTGPGALYVTAFEDLTISRSRFVGHGNEGNSYPMGAVVACNDYSPTLGPGNCGGPQWSFEDYDAGYDFESSVTVIDSEFADNASGHAGSHLTARYVQDVLIERTSFEGGRSQQGAAAWLVDNKDVVVRDTTFDDNEGRYTGSALAVHREGGPQSVERSLLVEDSHFTDSRYAPPLRTREIQDVTVRGSTFVGRGVAASAACGNTPNYSDQGEYMGGAAHIESYRTALVEDCSFAEFQAQSGGAVGFDNASDTSTVTVRRTSFTGNMASYAGGSLFLRTGATATLEDLTFEDTRSLCTAGGALNVEYFDEVSLTGSTFVDFGTAIDSGAAHIVSNDVVVVRDTTFAESKGTSSVGGALLVENGKHQSKMESVTLDGVTVESSASGSTGGGVKIGNADLVHVLDSVFRENSCDRGAGLFGTGWCLGVGLYAGDVGDLLVERSAFLDNAAVSDGGSEGQIGAGLAADRVHTLTVRASLFEGNLVTTNLSTGGGNRGAAIDFRPAVYESRVDPLSISVQGSTLVGNTSQLAPAISIDRDYIGDGPTVQTEVVNSIARDATSAPVVQWNSYSEIPHGSGVAIAFSNVNGASGGTNFDVDPQFGAPSPSDPYAAWRLGAGSPMIGAGVVDADDPVDLDGRTRASPRSIGAFEF